LYVIFLISLLHDSLRILDWNQLSGTIPPELGNLTMLQTMYAESHRLICQYLLHHISDESSSIGLIYHLCIVALSGGGI